MSKVEDKKEKAPERVWGRITVGMSGVRRGQRVLVDPTEPEMANLIAAGAVVVEEKP